MNFRHLLPALIAPALMFGLIGCSSNKSESNGAAASGAAASGSPGSGKTRFVSMGTAPVGGAFPVVGGAICEVLNQHKSTIDWKLSPKGTKGSQENIRRLQQNELELGVSNAAISYFAARGEAGWNEKFDVRSVATLAPNVAMFITRADSGVRSITDLKGKRVIIGPAGAGFQMFVEPILAEHGVAWNEISALDATQSDAVDLLADGSADAAFLGGAIPTSSISQATSTFDVHFIPYDAAATKALVEKYAFFDDAKIPAGTYKGLDADFAGLNVGSMHLITSAAQDEELIYQVTKAIWENREEIAQQHAAGKAINPNNVARDVGVEYHPGAIRYYKEAGVWPGSEPADAATQPAESSEPAADSEPEPESSEAQEQPVDSAT